MSRLALPVGITAGEPPLGNGLAAGLSAFQRQPIQKEILTVRTVDRDR